MKITKITYTVSLLLLGASALAGCESLDYAPGDQMSDRTFWQTEEHARQAAVGMYAAMRADWCFGLDFTFDMCSDLADGTTPWADISRGNSFASNSSGVQNHWQYLYELVHRANTVIRNVAGMPISGETIDRVTGEAKFLRAMAYFRMLNCWGGVPYYDETCDINEQFANLDSPRSSADEIRGHILDDLTDAIAKLPVRWDDANLGRATKGAAYALRGKVYLYNRQWDKAVADFEEIVYNRSNNYGYSLHPDYNELFRLYNGAHSPEMIFSIQSVDGNTPGYALNIVGYFGNKSTMRLIASNGIVPSTRLVDMYENLDGSPFDWDALLPGFKDGGPQVRRACMCVAINQGSTEVTQYSGMRYDKNHGCLPSSRPAPVSQRDNPRSHYLGTDAGSNPMDKQFVLADPSKEGLRWRPWRLSDFEGWNSYFWRKWIPTGNSHGHRGEYSRTPYEFPLITSGRRYSDACRGDNEGGCDRYGAVTEETKIRARVGMPGLDSGPAWLAVAGRDDMAERIRRERAFQLAGEGHRYWVPPPLGAAEGVGGRCTRYFRRHDVYAQLSAAP